MCDFNYAHPLHSEVRLIALGREVQCHDFSMNEECTQAIMKVLFCDAKEPEGKTIADMFVCSCAGTAELDLYKVTLISVEEGPHFYKWGKD